MIVTGSLAVEGDRIECAGRGLSRVSFHSQIDHDPRIPANATSKNNGKADTTTTKLGGPTYAASGPRGKSRYTTNPATMVTGFASVAAANSRREPTYSLNCVIPKKTAAMKAICRTIATRL